MGRLLWGLSMKPENQVQVLLLGFRNGGGSQRDRDRDRETERDKDWDFYKGER